VTEQLTILVPTRGRPANLVRLANACRATAPGARIIARLDADDIALERYTRNAPEGVEIRVGPRTRFVASLNEIAAEVTTPYIACLGDDVLPETPGWGDLMIAALGGRLGVAYGSDGLEHKHGPDLPTHVVLPTEIYHRLGWIALPALRHLFVDNVWRELGRAMDNFVYVPEAKLTHLHPWAGKASRDRTYTEANNSLHRDRDRLAFERWRDSGGLLEATALLTREAA